MKKLTKYKDCEKAVGLKPGLLPIVSHLPKKYQKALIADFKRTIITEAHNEEWIPDFTDYSQYKYSPWPKVLADKKRRTGFGLSYGVYVITYTRTHVGSRHLLKSSELSKHLFETFPKIFKDHLLLK